MNTFMGFQDGKQRSTPVPGQFFTELLPEIDHLAELKLTLYAIWVLDHAEGKFRYLQEADIASDERFLTSLDPRPVEAVRVMKDALERAVLRGTLLHVILETEQVQQDYYFLNSPKGRAAVDAIETGEWRPPEMDEAPMTLEVARPNIFQLYETHIGPLTPLMAEILRDAEELYPESWFEEAFRQAAERNVRNWRYVQAVLRAWKEKGHIEQNRKDTQTDRRSYSEGEFADFIEP